MGRTIHPADFDPVAALTEAFGSEWRRIHRGCQDWQFVSRDGRIATTYGKEPRLLTPQRRGRYVTVPAPRRSDGKLQNVEVHALVCEAFHGPCPDGMQTRHLDGDGLNNHADNLAWGTPIENEADKVRHGREPRGERNGFAKLTVDAVRAIRAVHASEGLTYQQLGERFHIHRQTAYRVVRGLLWAHI